MCSLVDAVFVWTRHLDIRFVSEYMLVSIIHPALTLFGATSIPWALPDEQKGSWRRRSFVRSLLPLICRWYLFCSPMYQVLLASNYHFTSIGIEIQYWNGVLSVDCIFKLHPWGSITAIRSIGLWFPVSFCFWKNEAKSDACVMGVHFECPKRPSGWVLSICCYDPILLFFLWITSPAFPVCL